MIGPFTWGQGGKALSATDVARNRKVAEALANRIQNPQNMWQGIQSAVGDIGGAFINKQADDAESAGRSKVAEALMAAQQGGDPNGYMSVLTDEFASPAQSAVAQALWQREMQQSEPGYQLDIDYKRAQIDALKAKPAAETFKTLTPDEVAAAGLPTGTYQQGSDGKIYPIKGSDNGLQVTTNPDGTTTVSMGGTGPKLTEGQSKDAFFYIKGDGANRNLEANEQSLTSLKDTVVNGVPLVGNYFTADGYKNANRDGKEFLAAVLRKESGGAITPDEWSYYGPMYLPAPGDGPDQITQKREARQRAMDALKMTSGPGQIVIDEYLRQNSDPAFNATPGAETQVSPAPAAATALPSGVTEEDIQFTMQKYGVSREEVLKRLGNGGA